MTEYPLLEDEDGAPYPEAVQSAVRAMLDDARRQALADAAAVFARNADQWIAERGHPFWSQDTEHAYVEGARVLASWAEDPSRMDGPLRGVRLAQPTLCGKDVGSRPAWMGPDQYTPCRCLLPAEHTPPCKCEHTIEEDG